MNSDLKIALNIFPKQGLVCWLQTDNTLLYFESKLFLIWEYTDFKISSSL